MSQTVPRSVFGRRAELVDAFEYAWGPLLVSALFALVLALSDPTHETLLALVENAVLDQRAFRQALLAAVMFIFVPVVLSVATRRVLSLRRCSTAPCRRVRDMLLSWVGRLPLLGMAVGIMAMLSGKDQVSDDASDAMTRLLWVLVPLLLYGLPALLRGFGVRWAPEIQARRWLRRHFRKVDESLPQKGLLRWLFDRQMLFLATLWRGWRGAQRHFPWVLALAALFLLVVGIWPGFARWLGPLNLASAFVMLAALALAELTRQSYLYCRGQTPLALFLLIAMLATASTFWIAVLAGLALLFLLATFWRRQPGRREALIASGIGALALSMVALHFLRPECRSLGGCNLVHPDPAAEAAATDIATAFEIWDAARHEGRDHSSPPLRRPILVAAQGGGLFTAYQTAIYLAKRADAEGTEFTHALFAISGVSGGSVGASAYWAVRASGQCDQPEAARDCHEAAVRQLLARDYLTPVLASLLTRDLLDSIVPYTALSPETRSDRGWVLEQSLTRRADEVLARGTAAVDCGTGALMDCPLAQSWQPRGGVPALFLNATEVHSGDRVVNAALQQGETALDGGGVVWGGAGLKVATAAVMSARFPLVTPPARLDRAGQLRQIVDGGYYDNSGIETLFDILDALRPPPRDKFSRILRLLNEDDFDPFASQADNRRGADRRKRFEVVVLHVENETCRNIYDPLRNADTLLECAKRGPADLDRDAVALKGLVGAPVAAFTGAWNSRRKLSQGRLTAVWDNVASIEHVAHVQRRFNFTVSWFLGKGTFCDIEAQMDEAVQRGNRAALFPRLPPQPSEWCQAARISP